MDVKEKIEYWLDLADYDLTTAKSMLKTKRYLYVGFMCHQVIEKMLKSYYWQHLKKEPPFIHNLTILPKKSGIYNGLSEEQKNLIDFLEPLNIRARYPRDKDELLEALPHRRARKIINDTESLFKWIAKYLKD